ncbi:glutamate 5-kinase, partial [Candidatus Nomurabacteria bacterium]|nr:glutamate 5-kinase [Candidatus Nomurabacteria bacterium]
MNEKDLYVIKIGTNTLVDDRGIVRDSVVSEVLHSVKNLHNQGKNVLLVTSGAVRLGRIYLKDYKANTKIAASVGQPILFNCYREKSNELGITAAEILLTKPYIA